MIALSARVRPAEVATVSGAATSLEELASAVRSLHRAGSTFLSTSGQEDLRLDQFLAGDPACFTELFGSYAVSLTWAQAVRLLPLPQAYVGTGGFPVWADVALAIYAWHVLRRKDVFWS